MAQYYAVERSSEYLAHYGVRGMKWGVRKAIERGNSKALARHYRKALNKLGKLDKKADINKQASIAKKYGKVAKIGLGVGASGLGISGISHLRQGSIARSFDSTTGNMWRALHPNKNWGYYNQENFVANNSAAKELHKKYFNQHWNLENNKSISAAIGVAGTGVGTIAGVRALAAKRHTTPGGHAKAVAERNEFQREMNKAFAGTKYGKKKRR